MTTDTLTWYTPSEKRPATGTMMVLCEIRQKYDNAFICKKGESYYQILSYYKKGIIEPNFYLYDLIIPYNEIIRWTYLPTTTQQ